MVKRITNCPEYSAPYIEVLEIVAEQVFAISNAEGMTEDNLYDLDFFN